MTDKVQEIIIEIKNRISNYQEYIDSGYDDEEVIKQEELKDLLTSIGSMQEEPVSEDLEEASKNYALNNTPWDDCKDEIQESFKAGAKWKEQQIMAIAVDGIARPYDNEIWCILDSFNLKDGDEVKVIVIKEK